MRLLIIRHADPEYAGDTLTADGFKQAEALGRRLSSGIEGELTHIYTSPLGRAKDTAVPTCEKTGLKPSIEEWTTELSDWPRLKAPDRLPIWCVDRGSNPDMSPYTDLLAQLHLSSDSFLAKHGYIHEGNGLYSCTQAAAKNRDLIAVFCHGGFGVIWLAYLLQIPIPLAAASFTLLPSSVTTILFDERGPKAISPRVIAMGDVGHLYADNLKIPDSKYEKKNQYGNHKRPSGIKANFW